jgi:hypothetical protein
MLEFFKQVSNTIVSDYIKDWLDSKALPSFAFICSSLGYYMLTQQFLGAIFLSLPLVYLVHKCKQNYSIKGKLLIIPEPRLEFPDNNIHNIRIAMSVYNCSSQVISCFLDQEKTVIIVNGQTHQKDELDVINKSSVLLPPYYLSNAATGIIKVKDISVAGSLKITATIALKYGILNNEKYEVYHKVHIEGILNRLENGSLSIQFVRKPPVVKSN